VLAELALVLMAQPAPAGAEDRPARGPLAEPADALRLGHHQRQRVLHAILRRGESVVMGRQMPPPRGLHLLAIALHHRGELLRLLPGPPPRLAVVTLRPGGRLARLAAESPALGRPAHAALHSRTRTRARRDG